MSTSVPEKSRAVPKIKGVALESFLEWYARTEGKETLLAIVRQLPEEQRSALATGDRGFGILASVWYDAPLIHGILDGMTRGRDAAARARLVEQGADATVRSHLRGIYKVLFQLFMTPERYASRAQALWDRYYDSGVVEKTVEAPNRHSAVVRDWASHHPILCEMNAATGKIIYEELGCKNVRSERTSCVASGGRVCSQVVTWDG